MDIVSAKTVILGTNQYPNLNETMLDEIKIDVSPKADLLQNIKSLDYIVVLKVFENLRLATEKYVKKARNSHPFFY